MAEIESPEVEKTMEADSAKDVSGGEEVGFLTLEMLDDVGEEEGEEEGVGGESSNLHIEELNEWIHDLGGEDPQKSVGINSLSATELIDAVMMEDEQSVQDTGNMISFKELDQKLGVKRVSVEQGEDPADINAGILSRNAADKDLGRTQQVREILLNPTSTAEQSAWAIKQVNLGLDIPSIFQNDRLAISAESAKAINKAAMSALANPEGPAPSISMQQAIIDQHRWVQSAYNMPTESPSGLVSAQEMIDYRTNNPSTQFYRGKADLAELSKEEWKQAYTAFKDEYFCQVALSIGAVMSLGMKAGNKARTPLGLLPKFDLKAHEQDMVAIEEFAKKRRKTYNATERVFSDYGAISELVANPYFDLGMPLAIEGFKFAKGLEVLNTTRKMDNTVVALSNSIGEEKAFAFTRASEDTCAQVMNDLSKKELEKIKKIVKKSNDPISQQVERAIEKVEGGEVVIGPPEPKVSAGAEQALAAKISGEVKVIESLADQVILANNAEDASHAGVLLRNKLRASEMADLAMFSDTPYAPIHPSTTFAEEVNNANIMGQTIGPHIEWRIMQAEGYGNLLPGPAESQVITNNVYLYNNEIGIGPSVHAWGGGTGFKAVDTFFTPFRAWEGATKEDWVIKANLALKEKNRLQEVISKNLVTIYKPLLSNKKDMQLFQNLLLEANDVERNWVATYGGVYMPGVPDSFRAASSQVQDAAGAYNRHHLDLGLLSNKTALFHMREAGVKYFSDTKQAAHRVVGLSDDAEIRDLSGNKAVWSEERKAAGDKLYIFTDTGFKEGDEIPTILTKEQQAALKQLPDTFQPIILKNGYTSIQYKEEFGITELILDEKGNVTKERTVGTARNRREADKFIKKFEDSSQGVHYSAFRFSEGRSDVVTGDFLNVMRRMTDAQAEELYVKLAANGRPEEYIQTLKKSREKYGYKAPSFAKKRSDQRLISAKTAEIDADTGELIGKPARMEISQDASSIYGNKVARFTALSPLIERLREGLTSKYGKYLTDPANALSLPNIEKIGSSNITLLGEVTSLQRQLKNIEGRPRLAEQFLESSRNNLIDKFVTSKHPFISVPLDVLEKFVGVLPPKLVDKFGVPTVGRTLRGGRRLAYQTVMGVGAVAMMPLQFYTAFRNVQLIGAGGKLLDGNLKTAIAVGARTNLDFVHVLGPFAGAKDELNWSTRGKLLWDGLQRSGYAAGVDWEVMRKAIGDPRAVNALTTGWMKKATKIPRTILFDAAATGEQMSQIYAWLGARNSIESLVKQGKFPTLSQMDLATNSQKFIEAVSRETMRIMPSMSAANKAGMSSGDILGSLTMLKQFAFEEFAQYYNLGGHLKGKELAALWVGTIATGGVPAIPGLLEAQWAIEVVMDKFGEGIPDSRGKLRYEYPVWAISQAQEAAKEAGLPTGKLDKLFDAYDQGALGVYSGNLLALNSRIAAQSVFTSFTQNYSMDENILGVGWSVMKDIASATGVSTKIVINAIEKHSLKDIPMDTFMALGEEVVDIPTGTKRIKQAVVAALTGEIKTSRGQLLSTHATLGEVILLGLGETPATIKRVEDYSRMLKVREDNVMTWVYAVSEKNAELYAEGHKEAGDAWADSVEDQLDEAGYPLLAGSYQRAVLTSKYKKDMPLEIRNIIDEISNPLSTRDSNKIIRGLRKRK